MAVAQRRIREKEVRRQQILDAARELFFTKGFSATIEEIAERSELSKGALYLYFGSKEEIYISLMHEGTQILFEMLKKAADADLPADTLLRRLGHAYFKYYEEYPGYFRMLFLYYMSIDMDKKISRELCESCERDARDCLSVVGGIISKGIQDGLFKPCNVMEVSVMLWTCQNGIILLGERGDAEMLKIETPLAKLHDLFLESTIVSLKAGR